MGLLGHTQNFNEYVKSLPSQEKQAMLAHFSQHGDPDQILAELMAMPVSFSSNKNEIRINENFLLWFEKKTLFKRPKVNLFKVDALSHCRSNTQSGNSCHIVLVFKDKTRICFSKLSKEEEVGIFSALRPFHHGFDRIRPYEQLPEDGAVKLPSYWLTGHYFFEGNSLCHVYPKEFSKALKKEVYISDVRQIIWCKQWSEPDGDANDSYVLRVYFSHLKKPYDIHCDSVDGAFRMAVELKRRVPHMLYGPSKEYEEIFKRDPAELMALAKSQER